jgi:ABC-type antimicrobial peptide transport system ATPase subunit
MTAMTLVVLLLGTPAAREAAAASSDDGLARVRASGELPWGRPAGRRAVRLQDPDDPGRIVGFEVEIADALARRLGVRAAFARALAMEPAVLLLDEPTSALDPRLTAEVLAVVADLAAAGRTMVVVTHEIAFARRVAGRAIVLVDGWVAEHGSAEEVLGRPRSAETRALLGLEP